MEHRNWKELSDTGVTVRAGDLIRRDEPSISWRDTGLPRETLTRLKKIHRAAGDHGLNVLFTGASGTGKTMAAEAFATALKIPLFRVDLGSVVSKYIGETEKNLDRVFEAAEQEDVVLFFDEADSLFGKRTEVSDARDRFANTEAGFLLERMEQHDGLVILATNLRRNLDEDFLSRLAHVVAFPNS